MNWEGIAVDIFKYALIASGVGIVYYVSNDYAKKKPNKKLKQSIIAIAIILGLSIFILYPNNYKIAIETFIFLSATALLGIHIGNK